MGRVQLGKVQAHWRINPYTRDYFTRLAKRTGFVYNDKGAPGELLDAIAAENEQVIDQMIKLLEQLQKRNAKRRQRSEVSSQE